MLRKDVRPLMRVRIIRNDWGRDIYEKKGTVVGEGGRPFFCIEFDKNYDFCHGNHPINADRRAYKKDFKDEEIYFWFNEEDFEPASHQLELDFGE